MALKPLQFTQPAGAADDEWKKMVADAAYYIAEKRNFSPGSAVDDWLAAEAQVEMEIAQRRLANISLSKIA